MESKIGIPPKRERTRASIKVKDRLILFVLLLSPLSPSRNEERSVSFPEQRQQAAIRRCGSSRVLPSRNENNDDGGAGVVRPIKPQHKAIVLPPIEFSVSPRNEVELEPEFQSPPIRLLLHGLSDLRIGIARLPVRPRWSRTVLPTQIPRWGVLPSGAIVFELVRGPFFLLL